jgi:hypothetical protein
VQVLRACRAVLQRLRALEAAEAVHDAAEDVSASPVIVGLQADVGVRRSLLEATLAQLLSDAVSLRCTDGGGGSLRVHAAVSPSLRTLSPSLSSRRRSPSCCPTPCHCAARTAAAARCACMPR